MPYVATIPFSTTKLDSLLENAGIDILVVTSKHNIRYLLGGYYHFQFGFMDAIGVSRFLPILIYAKGVPELTTYIANRNEKDAVANGRFETFWAPNVVFGSSGTIDAIDLAAGHIRTLSPTFKRIGIESAFMPYDAGTALRRSLPDHVIVEALRPLEQLRAVKSPMELAIVREASERVVQSMLDLVPGIISH